MSADTRKAFEEWAEGKVTSLVRSRLAAGYVYADTQRAWEAWLASRSQALEEAAQTCDRLTVALDGGGNEYRREALASTCAAAIRKLGGS